MARLYADENFDLAVVKELRQLGHDVLTAREAGRAGQGISDGNQLAYAISQGQAILTFDRRDFKRLHRQVRPHCGILVCTNCSDKPALAGRIHQAITTCPKLDNQLLCINRPP